jgi:hypothetical protein
MVVGFVLQVLIVALADGMFWYWQNKATIKTITDYPAPGQSRSHKAEWKGENFDRLLSRHVAFARAANAIDETRKDFDRVGWGGSEEGAPHFPGYDRLVQRWFTGNDLPLDHRSPWWAAVGDQVRAAGCSLSVYDPR